MNNEQALLILKSILDQAISKNVFTNIDAAFQACNAYNQLANIVKESTKNAKTDNSLEVIN